MIKSKSKLYHFSIRLKVDCEKLSQEKTEMQRHYVMVCQFIIQHNDILPQLHNFNISL